jgi:hypothetical protein
MPRFTVTPWVELPESLAVVADDEEPEDPELADDDVVLDEDELLPPPQAASANDTSSAANTVSTAAGRGARLRDFRSTEFLFLSLLGVKTRGFC